MEWITEHQTLIVALVIAIYAVAQIVVRLTPTKKDDEVLAKLLPIGLLLGKVDWSKMLLMLSAFQNQAEVAEEEKADEEAEEEEDEAGDAAEPPDVQG
jgi:hypothetical protein